MSVREAVSLTDARKAGTEVSVGLAMPSPPSLILVVVGHDNCVPDWSMKNGLLHFPLLLDPCFLAFYTTIAFKLGCETGYQGYSDSRKNLCPCHRH